MNKSAAKTKFVTRLVINGHAIGDYVDFFETLESAVEDGRKYFGRKYKGCDVVIDPGTVTRWESVGPEPGMTVTITKEAVK